MAIFRFRAQAALDMRRREDEAAQRVKAAADAALREAQARLHEADARLVEAASRPMPGADAGGAPHDTEWYRFWILRLRQEVAVCVAAVAAAEGTLAVATAARHRTHQRVESLDRLKDKTRRTHDRAALAEEQKETDAVGTMRFVAARIAR